MNQYTSVGGAALTYDGNFNQTGYGTQSATFNAANQLTSLVNPGNGASAQFTYDGLGRCVRRTVNGTTRLFTYDGWKPMLEWDGAGNWVAWNIYGAGADEILARYDSSDRVLIYKQDKRGNVVGLLDNFGNVIEKYTYDAFGQPTVTDYWGNVRSESAYGNRFMFTGREYIKELGLYDYRNRFYHPALGRFMQGDPIGFGGGDANLFRYCGGDPVNWSDPSGLVDGHTFILILKKPYEPRRGIDFNPSTAFVNHAMDWGPIEQVMQYFGGGDHGRSGGGFSGLGDIGSVADGHSLRGVADLIVGANGGEAWRRIASEGVGPGPTGGILPVSLAKAIDSLQGRLPSNAAANGMHAWHSGSNAYLAQQLGLIGAPYIILGGIIHETPLDWSSFWAEQGSQGTINHIIDSTMDIVANLYGMNIGYLQPGPTGVDNAIRYGNFIPGPADYGPNHRYQGDPSRAWGP